MNVCTIIELKEGEAVVCVVKNHWIVELHRAMFAFLLIATPLFFARPLFGIARWGVPLFVLSICAGVLYAARALYVWYWNGFIVTTHRVIDVDQRGFLNRTVSQAMYDKLQDVSYSIKGVSGMVFHYGTVDLQTSGGAVALAQPNVCNPKEVHHLITMTMAAYLARNNASPRT